MKYIAVFDVPDDNGIGCAVAKIAPKNHGIYTDADFTNIYAQVEPLAEEKAKVFDAFNTIIRLIYDMGLANVYDMPSFWTKSKEFKVIPTQYHKGYMQALDDAEKAIRHAFGFAEQDGNVIDRVFGVESQEVSE